MKRTREIQAVESAQMKKDIPEFKIGDTLNIHTRIIEGEKERIQIFNGTVIARRGSGISETIALYKVSYGSGIERVFMIHSPKIAKIEVAKKGKVRKSKLYYLRGIAGKKAKVEEKIGASVEAEAAAPRAES